MKFHPDAVDRWRKLQASSHPYDVAVRHAIRRVLTHLDKHPDRHRMGAHQFNTNPVTWARTVDVPDGAGWIIAWTVEEDGIHIKLIEPSPSLA